MEEWTVEMGFGRGKEVGYLTCTRLDLESSKRRW